jgi:crotonobetaine/carnitine-CoA ligase
MNARLDRTTLYPQLVAKRASETPDKVFLHDADGLTLTYGAFSHDGLRWADAYRRIGVQPGENVLVMVPGDIDFFRSSLGLSWLRAVEVPINTDYRGAMLRHAVTLTAPKTLVADARFLDRFAEVAADLPSVETMIVWGDGGTATSLPWRTVPMHDFLAPASPATDLAGPEPWDVAAIFFTSGTTGPSKGVVQPWGHTRRQSQNFIPIEDLGPDDVFYTPFVAIYHIGSKVLPYLCAMIGGKLAFRTQFSPLTFWTDVQATGATTTALVGALVPMVFSQDAPKQTTLRNVILAPAPPNVDEYKARFGIRVGAAYSMTEISNPVASDGWSVDNGNHASCGRLKPGFDVRIVDEHDYEVPVGEVGEMIVRSDEPWTMNLGYYGMPEATAHAWRNGWFHTGDGFKIDPDGNYYFVDRVKDCIRRRAENISSFEVEGLVNTHADVIESAAIPVPSELVEDEVMVLVVRKPGSELTHEALVAHCIATMPRFMVPRYVEFVDELPKTPTQRVKKRELRERGVTKATWDRAAAGITVPR